MKIILSKTQWNQIGQQAGWIKIAQKNHEAKVNNKKSIDLGRYDKSVTVSFNICGDAKSEVLALLDQLRYNGQVGHSFNIRVDEEQNENYKTYSFDGDGADRISDIKVNGVDLPSGYWTKD